MQTIRTLKAAKAIAGSLGKPSKMPGLSYGISAKRCIVGAKLATIEGSVCHGCYALKANYSYPSVMKAHETRFEALRHPQWTEAMTFQIDKSKTEFFRWHDACDLQNLQHLLNIVKIAEALPLVKFWIPTREKKIVNQFVDTFGAFPDNLNVRVSAAMIDGDVPAGFANTSTVHEAAKAKGTTCEAYKHNNKCNDCRKCWDKSVANVSYKKH
jgi:hypothetical protein